MSLDVRIKKSFGDYTLDVAFAGGDETLGFLGASGSVSYTHLTLPTNSRV